MADQAQMTETVHQPAVHDPSINKNLAPGPDAKPVTRKVSEFATSVKALADLQLQLLKVDLRECVQQIRLPAMALCMGLFLGAACFPVLLAALGLLLVENFDLSYSAAFGIAVAVGLGLSLILSAVGWSRIVRGMSALQRSRQEFVRNLHFVRGGVKHQRISRRHLFDVFGGQ